MKKYLFFIIVLLLLTTIFVVNERSIAFATKSTGSILSGSKFKIKIGEKKDVVIAKMETNKFQAMVPRCGEIEMNSQKILECEILFFDDLYAPGTVRVIFFDDLAKKIIWNYEQER